MDSSFLRLKEVPPVLPAASLIDVCLSKTQRKTPTEIHRRSKLGGIKKFYMRKMKFGAQAFTEKLREIVDGFPKLDNIHPFYGDLLNILYDRDHYKLALGMISATSRRIEKIAKEYVTLCKYADGLYKCKSLKIAALGRMCTLVKKLGQPLQYLEEARQHMSRLPSINPVARTLLLTGYPNVGKSSFINRISHANVDVQPFAFTTKSLFVGHFDYMYTRWQVIDTPGILDHPLEERNVIEMVAITALTHIQSTVLYLLDLSEECGYSIEMQVSLFHSLGVLFKNKDVVIVLNKTDKVKMADLTTERQQLIRDMGKEVKAEFVEVSTLTGLGVDEAKNRACDLLLKRKVEQKLLLLSTGGKTAATGRAAAELAAIGLEDRMYITAVSTPREPFIPQSVLRQRIQEGLGLAKNSGAEQRVLERDLMEENGGAGVYSADLRKKYILAKEEWKYDVMPEFFNGHNVRDFVDEDIEEKLRLLEEEEERLREEQEKKRPELEEQLDTLTSLKMEMATLHMGVKRRRLLNNLRKKKNGPRLLKRPKSRLTELREQRKALAGAHAEEPAGEGSAKSADKEKAGSRKRGRSIERTERRSHSSARSDRLSADGEEDAHTRMKKKLRALSRSRNVKPTAQQRAAAAGKPLEDETIISAADRGAMQRLGGMEPRRARKLKIASDRKIRGRAGEADRHISVKLPKHLFAGKRGNGKTDRR